MDSNDDDARVLRDAIDGERVALEQLLHAYYGLLLRHVERKLPKALRTIVNAEDIVQEAMSQASKQIQGFQSANSSSFLAWLKTIADHRLTDAVRHHGRQKRGGGVVHVQASEGAGSGSWVRLVEVLEEEGPSPRRPAKIKETMQAVHVALSQLSGDERQAIRLRYFSDQSLDEVAAAIGRTPAATRGVLHRAKQKLRASMGRWSDWLSTQ